jgi:hypothetical protein
MVTLAGATEKVGQMQNDTVWGTDTLSIVTTSALLLDKTATLI